MRRSNWTRSIVPRATIATSTWWKMIWVDWGTSGREAETTDFETVVSDLLTGQYSNPLRVVAFNVAEGWSRDASGDVAHELRQRCDLQLRDIPFFLHDFVDRYEGRYSDVQLPLPMRLV